MPAHYPPPDHGGRHQCGLRFFVLRRPGAPAAPEPGPRAEGKASEPDTRSPARHAAPISRRTTEAAIYAASVFLTSAAPAPRQLQSRSPPPWSGTDTPAVPKPGLAPQGKHRSSARNIPAARHPHHPEPAGKAFPSPAPAVSHRPSRSSYPPGSLKRSGPRTGTASLHPRPRRRPESARHTHPAPAPKAPSRTSLRLPYTPTTRRGSAPEPAPPHIRILARTIRPPEPAGKKHPLPATSSTSAPPEKPPPRASLRPYAPTSAGKEHRSPHHPTSASSPAPSASPPPSRLGKSTLFLPRLPHPRYPTPLSAVPHQWERTGARHTQPGTSRSVHPPPDHGGRHQCGLRFLSSTASPRLFRHPLRHPVWHYPPPHTDSRLPDDTSVQHSLAPRPPLRRPNQPPTHTSCRASPRPLPDRHKKAAPGTGTATLHPHPQHSTPAPSAFPRTGWEKAPSSCHAINARAARKSAAPHLSPPPRTRPHQGKAPEPAPTHPHPRPPAPLSDSLLTRPTQAPPLATPQRPKKRHPASRRPPPRAFPHLQVPPPPRQAQKKRQPAKGCRASFKPPGD